MLQKDGADVRRKSPRSGRKHQSTLLRLLKSILYAHFVQNCPINWMNLQRGAESLQFTSIVLFYSRKKCIQIFYHKNFNVLCNIMYRLKSFIQIDDGSAIVFVVVHLFRRRYVRQMRLDLVRLHMSCQYRFVPNYVSTCLNNHYFILLLKSHLCNMRYMCGVQYYNNYLQRLVLSSIHIMTLQLVKIDFNSHLEIVNI